MKGEPSYRTIAAPTASALTIQFHIIHPVWRDGACFHDNTNKIMTTYGAVVEDDGVAVHVAMENVFF